MENEATPSADYIKGFNEGYILNKYDDEMSKALSQALPENDRSIGFKDGMNEWVLEKNQAALPKWMRKDRLTDLSGSSDKELHKGKDIEPDME